METKADWLRSEVEKLESAEMVKSNIITRYKEELKVLESKYELQN